MPLIHADDHESGAVRKASHLRRLGYAHRLRKPDDRSTRSRRSRCATRAIRMTACSGVRAGPKDPGR
jgi:hypothetical protein